MVVAQWPSHVPLLRIARNHAQFSESFLDHTLLFGKAPPKSKCTTREQTHPKHVFTVILIDMTRYLSGFDLYSPKDYVEHLSMCLLTICNVVCLLLGGAFEQCCMSQHHLGFYKTTVEDPPLGREFIPHFLETCLLWQSFLTGAAEQMSHWGFDRTSSS